MGELCLKMWKDPVTAPEELQRMKAEYEEEGYKCNMLLNCLELELVDGSVLIYWKNGGFYQDFLENSSEEHIEEQYKKCVAEAKRRGFFNENKYVIKVLDKSGKWYENAIIENDFDALQVAKFYREQLGYEVQLWHDDKDITFLIGSTQNVILKK